MDEEANSSDDDELGEIHKEDISQNMRYIRILEKQCLIVLVWSV
jgi:hypothetical protein